MPDEINIDEQASDRAVEPSRIQTQTVRVYLTREGSAILVRHRAEGESGLTADLVGVLRPGASFMGQPWVFRVGLGPARHEIPANQPGTGGPGDA
jgi:hypothetical protein